MAAWAFGLTAEQDNGVKIPNGTAAVYAAPVLRTKVGHWGNLGRLNRQKSCNPLHGMSQKTYARIALPHSAQYKVCVCHGKTAVAPIAVPRIFCF